jgi:hypothetical protein
MFRITARLFLAPLLLVAVTVFFVIIACAAIASWVANGDAQRITVKINATI